jgi:hypothetical protein
MLVTQVGEQLRQRVPAQLAPYGLVHVRRQPPAADPLAGCLDELMFEAH